MTYLDFFELTQEPFSNAPVSRFYFDSTQHSQALTRLEAELGQAEEIGFLLRFIRASKRGVIKR